MSCELITHQLPESEDAIRYFEKLEARSQSVTTSEKQTDFLHKE